MQWVTAIWSLAIGACLSLAALHGLLSLNQPGAMSNRWFALAALGTAGLGACELAMMRSSTPAGFTQAVRWIHIPTLVIVVALVGFIRVHLRAGRPHLGWAACGLRAAALIPNYLSGTNLNYRVSPELISIPFLGDVVTAGRAAPNPWMLVGQLGLVLLVAFAIDATRTAWRRGEARQALIIGGSVVLFTTVGLTQAVLVFWGVVEAPITVSPFFAAIVAAVGLELKLDLQQTARLARDLRESEERMSLAADAAGVGIWVWNLARNEVWGSEHWLRLFGLPPSPPPQHRAVMDRLHPDDRETVQREVQEALELGAEYAGEFRVVLPDGQTRWIAARGRKLSGSSPTEARMLGAALDITARKQSEDDLRQQRLQLAHLSRVTVLGELAGSIAHELNQPLTAILANVQAAQRFLTREPPDLAEIREILSDVATEDQRAGEIIRRLRLLLGKGEVIHQPLPINEVVEEVLKLVRNDLLTQGVTVRLDLEGSLPPVRGDRIQLQQVLVNLVMNGCDAMTSCPSGQRQLDLRTSRTSAGQVQVSVSDNGSGLPTDHPEKVFQPFFTTKPQGMGLGLTVCRTIVAAHGGRLWAAPNPRGGATFHFTVHESHPTPA